MSWMGSPASVWMRTPEALALAIFCTCREQKWGSDTSVHFKMIMKRLLLMHALRFNGILVEKLKQSRLCWLYTVAADNKALKGGEVENRRSEDKLDVPGAVWVNRPL